MSAVLDISALIADPADVRPEDVCGIIGVTPARLRRLIATGDFPAPDLRYGKRGRRWRRSTLLRWIDDRQSQSPVPATAV